MGFTSIDDWIAKTTAGQFYRADWNKMMNAATGVAGSWMDCALLSGNPPANVHGEHVINGAPYCTAGATTGFGYTFGAQFLYGANKITKPDNSTAGSFTVLGKALVNTRVYRVVFTMVGTCATGVKVTLGGGTSGTLRTTANTYTESITAGSDGTGIVFTSVGATVGLAITVISVIEILAATTMEDTQPMGALYHGGNVSPKTKHILNAEVHSVTATWNPAVWLLVDQLMCYPYIDMNSNTEQTLINNNTLPRYTDGVGVKAYLAPSTTLGAVAHTISIKYTNTLDATNKLLPVTVAGTTSCALSRIDHSGIVANNYAPFLPLAPGDLGMKSIQNITISAATGSVNYATLVMCKPLMNLPCTTAAVASERDLMNQLPSLPRVYDGANLQWLCYLGGALVASTSQAYGSIDFCWG